VDDDDDDDDGGGGSAELVGLEDVKSSDLKGLIGGHSEAFSHLPLVIFSL
jgi:hypothetical protein